MIKPISVASQGRIQNIMCDLAFVVSAYFPLNATLFITRLLRKTEHQGLRKVV